MPIGGIGVQCPATFLALETWSSASPKRTAKYLKSYGYNECVEFAIRNFSSHDFETLWGIDQLCFVPGIAYSREELNFYITKANTFTLIAEYAPGKGLERSPGIVGFIVAEAKRAKTGHIITIDVVPQARRSGVGSKLMESAEERLRRAHCNLVTLETAVDNKSALAFYKRHGYFVEKTVPRYYSNGVDAFVLAKELLAEQHGSFPRN